MNREKFPVYAALASDLGIAIVKFITSGFTGSSSMFSEGVHSFVECGNEILLLIGMKRSKKPADEMHNFGYGTEIYFWTLLVSMLLFATGGGVSIYRGISTILHPKPLEEIHWNYIVLGFAFLFDGTSLVIAYRKFSKDERESNFWKAVRKSKNAVTFTILVDNLAAVIGLALACLGITLSYIQKNPFYDGLASVLIGILLCVTSVFLVKECMHLIVGESVDVEMKKEIKNFSRQDEDVELIVEVLTMYFAPDEILLAMNVNFKNHLTSNEIQAAINRMEKNIKEKFPTVKRIFIQAESKRR